MSITTKIISAVACAAGTLALAPLAGTADPPATSMAIPMRALNGSGENGTATLTQVGDKVRVTIALTGEDANASEPAHVHYGHCPNIKAVPAYNVGPVVGGKATSIVDLSWNEITSGKYVVNVHESEAMLGKYVSCGDIGGSATPGPLPTEDSGY